MKVPRRLKEFHAYTVGEILVRIKPKYFKFLGKGAYASVWQIDSHRVLKISLDHTDARAAIALRGRRLSWVAKVHDVFCERNRYEGMEYFIVMEFCPNRVHDRAWSYGLNALYDNNFEALDQAEKDVTRWCRVVGRWMRSARIHWDDGHANNVRLTRTGKPVITDFGQMYGRKMDNVEIPRL